MEFIDREFYKNKFGIYAIENIENGKVYIGQTGQNFLRRYLHHNWKLKDGTHDNKHLQKAFYLYGGDKFRFIILDVVSEKSLLDDLEIKYISIYQDKNLSYNMLQGGKGRRGFSMSEHAKRIVGEKNRQHMLGAKHSEITKQRMRETRLKKPDYLIYRKETKLSDELVLIIKMKLIQGEFASDISKELDIDYKLINNMISNNTWEHIIVDGWNEYRKLRPTYTRLTKKRP